MELPDAIERASLVKKLAVEGARYVAALRSLISRNFAGIIEIEETSTANQLHIDFCGTKILFRTEITWLKQPQAYISAFLQNHVSGEAYVGNQFRYDNVEVSPDLSEDGDEFSANFLVCVFISLETGDLILKP